MLEVRPADPGQIDQLCAAFPDRPRVVHEERLLHQEEGHGPYLIARLDGVPVGHIQLQLPDERDLDAMIEGRGAAWAEDLWVKPSSRGHWAGPALMRAMQTCAREAGVTRVVFFAGISPDYAAARSIYRWMGWRERRPEPFIESATLAGLDGTVPYLEVLTLWEKELRP